MAISDYPKQSSPVQWLEGKSSSRIINFVVIPILLIAVFLLPPVSVVQRVQDAGMTNVSSAGGTISDPDGMQVSFAPGTARESFRVKLSSVPRTKFLEGSAGSDLVTAAKAIPVNLVAKSPFYQLAIHGTAPSQSTWVIPIPNDSEPYETLDIYAWDKNTGRWQWLPRSIVAEDDQVEAQVPFVPESAMVVQTNPVQAAASADLALASSLPGDSQAALTQVHPTGLYLGGGSSLDGTLDAGFEKIAASYAVAPIIRNYSGPIVRNDLLANMLVDENQRTAHVDALVNLVVGSGYNGVTIDYHGLDPADKADFNKFIAALAEKLHAQNKTLGVRVERPVQIAEDRWDTGAFDWQVLGMLADTVQIPAPLDPQAYVPNGQLDSLLRYAVGLVDRYRLEIAFSGQSVEQAGSYFLLKSYADALQPLIGRVQTDQEVVKPGEPLNLSLASKNPNSGLVYDPTLGNYIYRYADDQGNPRTVWLENAASLSHKLQILNHYNVRGFVVENLPAEGQDPDLWTLMRNYQQGHAQPINSNMMVEWTVKDSAGKTITQSRPVNDSKLAVMAPAQPGQLQIQASVKDRGQTIAQATSASIAVATYTPTATPTPLATATPEPTATPAFAQFTVSADLVNVRDGPGTEYAKVGQIKNGETYRVTGKAEQGNWLQFDLGDKKGWVTGDMVNLTGALDTVAMVKVAAPPTAVPQPASAAQAAPAAGPVKAAPAPTGGGSFGYGIQVAGWDRAGVARSIQGMGFNWVKEQVPWKDIEGSPGAMGWGSLDDMVANYSGAGLKILVSVPKAPAWARPGGTDLSVEGPPADPNTYANFVGQLAGRYCGKVNAIEVWNEQNLWYEWGHQAIDPAAYVRLLSAAYRAIKGACPATYVISGALTPTGANPPIGMDDFAYLEGMYQAGLRNVSDGIGAHPSGFNLSPDTPFEQGCAFVQQRGSSFRGPCDSPHHSWSFNSTLRGYWNIMAKYGDTGKKIWPTEFGWATNWIGDANYSYAKDNSQSDQAQWTVRAYQLMRSWGFVGPAFLWNLNFNATNPGTELAQWGILGTGTYSALAGMAK